MRVVMLIQNDWKTDSRVIRGAECLARHDYHVHVIFRRPNCDRVRETQNGVVYHGIPSTTRLRLADLLGVLRTHFKVVILDGLRIIHGPAPFNALGNFAQFFAIFLAGFVGAALFFLLGVLYLLLKPFYPASATNKANSSPATKRSTLHRVRRWIAIILDYWFQPFLYLNQFERFCADDINVLNPDIVHAHDLVTLSAGALAAMRLGCRLVYDAHELETQVNNWSLNAWSNYWVAKYEGALARRADAVITVSESIADWLGRKYQIPRPVVILNSPVLNSTKPGNDDSTGSASLRSRLGLHDEDPLLVYVGSVMIDRGLDQCVRALPHLPGVHFATVGPRYSAIEAEMRQIAQALGVTNRLHFVNPVPSENVVPFIASADCSVIPIQNVCLSYYFSFPNKLLESVIAGLPVAVANLLEMRKFVEENRVGLVMDETDPRSIAETVRQILSNRAAYRLSPEKIAEIANRYGWQAQEARLIQLYSSLEDVI